MAETGFTIPGFPKRWTLGLQIIVLLFILSAVGTAIYFAYPMLSGSSSKADIKVGINNFVGFAPGIELNNGLAANKECRYYNEFDVTVEFVHSEDMDVLNDMLRTGEIDVIFTTTDITPIKMEKGGDMAKMEVQQFLKLNDSRGADVFVVDEKIKSIEELKGKTIACALGWPSNTLLHKTLEAGGLTEADVTIANFDSPEAAQKAYISKNSDAAVVWSPMDIECLNARPSRVLTSTSLMPNIIMDGFCAKKSTIEKKKEELIKFAKGWLTANAEMSVPSNMEKAAKAYKLAFSLEESVKDMVEGMKTVHFATYGDNINFFGLSTDFSGTTGQALYNGMARAYKNGYGNNLSEIVPWAQASNPSIVQGITGLNGEMHEAEGQISFTPSTNDQKEESALATKHVSVNFATGAYLLSDEEKTKIRREVGNMALDLAGFRIRIEGNTDNTGQRDFNVKLSQKRAQSVADYLVREYNFDKNRFIVVGNGPDKPISSNDSEAGRAENRRTDFEFIK